MTVIEIEEWKVIFFGVWGNNQIKAGSPSVLKQHRREVTQTLIAALIKEHRRTEMLPQK